VKSDRFDNGKEGVCKTLDSLRSEIDRIDDEIVALICSRQQIAAELGAVKKEMGEDIYDPVREEEILQRLCGGNIGELNREAIRRIFREIMAAARSVQAE
jgi:chorismate mutase-like protein